MLALLYYVTAAGSATDPSNSVDVGITFVDPASEEVVAQAVEALSRLSDASQRIAGGDEAADGKGAESPHDGVGVPTKRDGCVWWEGASAVSIDLAEMFTLGHLDARVLWRHKLLNRAHRAPCPDEVREFQTLVDEVNRSLDKVTDHHAGLRLQEIVERARSGMLEEWVPPKPRPRESACWRG